MTKNNKKQRYNEENRSCKDWKDDHEFTMQGDRPFCLIFKKFLCHNIASYVKRQQEITCKNFSRYYLPKLISIKNK